MGARFKLKTKAELRTEVLQKAEALDKAEGWIFLKRFKNKTELAMYANDPENIADLEYRYPFETFRRKLDIDNLYLAVVRRR